MLVRSGKFLAVEAKSHTASTFAGETSSKALCYAQS